MWPRQLSSTVGDWDLLSTMFCTVDKSVTPRTKFSLSPANRNRHYFHPQRSGGVLYKLDTLREA